MTPEEEAYWQHVNELEWHREQEARANEAAYWEDLQRQLEEQEQNEQNKAVRPVESND